ncbi:MAG: UDP-N-acetylglucosamine--N-acetylmuramyl-(pentapeptide) pyrophosphoryl-undecaprenol N-acetylglucosamine transferase [marine bacterium B5-7]|nr:MAG: UDP-N-acetylglucosamine--N-acetylmuramyl-(pentapeptide) pyrophosphoryl-undecaprenol N-acetylglucosamine transferase [marine bacterium B5-7]
MRDKNILIMAGGTGGHIYPALAVADCLKEHGFNLFWLGTDKGLEANVVPNHGYPLLKINVAGVRGKGLVRLLFMPIMLSIALIQALSIMIKVRPVAVLGMGGFASGPGGVAAWLMRIPLLIHEQNAIAGLTNKLLAPFAVSVMAAFPGAFKESAKITITGNPVRTDIANLPKPEKRSLHNDARQIKVLVLGGSLGAKALNDVVPKSLLGLCNDYEIEVKHQCGEKHYATTSTAYNSDSLKSEVTAFIDDMASAYAWADIVVCRAGALTVAELAACGVGSILIPFPYAVDDHQTANANYLASEGAAVLLQETQLNVEKLKEIFVKLLHAPDQLLQMAIKARLLAKPEATKLVANLCMEAAHG